MNKQLTTIRTYLPRSAFYVLLLLAVCVIPFALAQRNSSKQAAAVSGNTLSHPTAISTVGDQARVPSPLLPSDAQSVPSLPRTPQIPLSPGGGGCTFRVLIVYSDVAGTPNELMGQILAEPDVTAVDLFDAFSGTPTLALLQQYDIVYAFSNNVWFDAVAMGDVLADYEDGGGVVVVSTFAWDNRGGWLLQGRWVTGGYSPYNSTSTTLFSTNTATITDPSHPLMQGVSSLTAFYRNGVTLTSGAASVAVWTDGPPAVAYKENNGHTAVGLNAYLGIVAEPFTGEWGRTIVNAGRWLSNCGPTPTPTPTPAQIVLTYQARRGAGRETVLVRLMWTGANSPRVDIYRNGEPLARVDNTGTYTDTLTEHAFFTYKVCEGHSRNCSNEVTVRGP
jgi:hypothetical protein